MQNWGALANAMGVKSNEVIRYLMKELGMMVTVNQTVDVETAELVAAEYGFTVQDISFNEESFTSSKADKPEDMELRAPIVTVMPPAGLAARVMGTPATTTSLR